mmetsp:Transcript_19236/g.34019  ORF Transcript_19236/g.34019 Transcript_19236/m.34019 type:complete len:236 (+) Transcript_19236:1396-2103(+)
MLVVHSLQHCLIAAQGTKRAEHHLVCAGAATVLVHPVAWHLFRAALAALDRLVGTDPVMVEEVARLEHGAATLEWAGHGTDIAVRFVLRKLLARCAFHKTMLLRMGVQGADELLRECLSLLHRPGIPLPKLCDRCHEFGVVVIDEDVRDFAEDVTAAVGELPEQVCHRPQGRRHRLLAAGVLDMVRPRARPLAPGTEEVDQLRLYLGSHAANRLERDALHLLHGSTRQALQEEVL